MESSEINKITKEIIGCAIKVHKELGAGLLESSYEECICYELAQSGLEFKRQHPMPLVYKEIKMEIGYRPDIIVAEKVIVEIKAVEALNDVHTAQVLTYLKLSGCDIGLLINFNVEQLTKGIKRFLNKESKINFK
ncbi:MAG TPA: GxxExxY protein [Flavobacteriales bacterium]|nr:GxxExxY protein [Flavobacteriales bacterium]